MCAGGSASSEARGLLEALEGGRLTVPGCCVSRVCPSVIGHEFAPLTSDPLVRILDTRHLQDVVVVGDRKSLVAV